MVASSQWLVTLLMLTSPAIHADAPSDAQFPQVEKAITDYLAQQKSQGILEYSQFEVGKLDPRLHLAECESKLDITEMQKNGPHLRLKVRCEQPKPWQLHLPVTLKHYEIVVVAKESLARQQILEAKQLRLSTVDTATLTQGYYHNPEELIGKMVKTPIALGGVIAPQAITSPHLIRRGEQIQIVAHQAGLTIRARGIAMGDGALGEKVRVKNMDTGRSIDAIVSKEGEVEITLRSTS